MDMFIPSQRKRNNSKNGTPSDGEGLALSRQSLVVGLWSVFCRVRNISKSAGLD